MLHGCTGPLFFALTVAMVVFTSRALGRTRRSPLRSRCRPATFAALAVVTAVLAYLQIVLGAVLRHVPVDAQPATFMLAREVSPVPGGRADVAHRRCCVGSCCSRVRRSRDRLAV